LPFWVVQATEIALGVAFIDISVHVSNGGLLVASAIAFFTLAVTAKGPLGVARICSQPLHLALAMAVAVLVAIAPVLPGLRPDIEGIIVLEFGAVGLLRVCTLTRVGTGPGSARSSRQSRRGRGVIDATATVAGAGAPPAPGSPAPRPAAATPPAGGGSGSSPSGSSPSGSSPSGSSPSGVAARWAGRTTGSAAVAGKQAAAKYGPTARAQIKRTVRAAGRMAGSVTSPAPDQSEPGS
jgi:hypothetical protein